MSEGKPLMCTCNDYEENIPKINAGFVMSHIHGMSGYQGKEISFCPWRQKN